MNLVNVSDSCESEDLLMGLLKEKTSFPGFVVPDIGSQKTMNGSANGGLDWSSDQLWMPEKFAELVTSGQLQQYCHYGEHHWPAHPRLLDREFQRDGRALRRTALLRVRALHR